MKRRGIFSLSVAAILVVTLLLFLVCFQVRLNQSAIVFTFGQVRRVITDPGLYWKLPYPIQTVTRYDARVNVLRDKYDEGVTKDQHTLITTVAFGWAIQQPRLFYESVGDLKNAREKLSGLVGGAAKNVINKHELSEFISTDPKTFRLGGSKDGIEEEIHAAVKDVAAELYGVDVPFLKIAQLGFPDKVTQDVIKRITAERAEKAEEYRSQGDRDADKIRSDAELARSKILNQAEATAIAERAKGDAAATKFYKPFKKNPELAAFLRELQAIERLKQRTTIILTTDNPIWRLLNRGLKIPGAEKPTATPKPPPAPGK
ncbi:protease modulator HflC [bacterium]|nr:protease modulator HflC [bacterium]